MTTIADDQIDTQEDTAFFGHPSGLGWLSFCEFWERFSYYGMAALLVLYMTHTLLHPGHVEHIWGFSSFRAVVSRLYGAHTPRTLAAAIYGLYSGFVYLVPIIGGWLADRFIGRTRAVVLGACLMAMGHFLMAFEQSFLLALSCLLAGTGCFKGNISSQVGDLYAVSDPRRADAYQVFLFFVQIAVIASPFVCGTLGQVYGWHWGFGAAGIGMLIGLGTYLAGKRTLPPDPVIGKSSKARPNLTPAGRTRIVLLLALIPILALSFIGNNEGLNAYVVWGEANYQLTFFGHTMPITWLLSFSAVVSAVTIAISAVFWRWWSKHWAEPDELAKMTIGIALAGLAVLFLVAASAFAALTHQRVSLGWAAGFEIVNDFGFANLYPVGLALYSRAAPKGFTSIMIGVFFLQLFVCNLFVGWLAGLLETMPATAFWFLHFALIAFAAVALLAVRILFGHVLAPAYDAPRPEI